MKRKVKGFTLIECLIAMAILAVASLTMAQIYAGVSSMNKRNHFLNDSMSNQTAYIEKMSETDGVTEYKTADITGTTPPSGTNQIGSSYIAITDADGNTYSYPVDVYYLDTGHKAGDGADMGNDLRYKFFTAHKP